MEPNNLLTGPDTWWSSANLRRHAARYAALAVVLTLLTWLVLALSGASPYGRRGGITWPLLIWCIVVGLWTYRRRGDTLMGFGRALGLGALTTGLATGGIGLVLTLFVSIAPTRLLETHRAEVRAGIEADRTKFTALPGGAAVYARNLASIAQIGPVTIAVQDGLLRLLIGLLTSLLAAILLRKATPDDAEPERAPRPPGV